MGKSVRTSKDAKRRIPRWLWGMLLIVLLAVGFVFWQAGHRVGFRMQAGDTQVLVLLHNRHDGHYTVQYTGNGPVELNTFKVMLAGEVLHMDVDTVVLHHQGQEYRVEAGQVQGETPLVLQPGDTLEVTVTYLGQTLGSNYLYGFRLGYRLPGGEGRGWALGSREGTYDLILKFEYAVFVE